MTVAAVLGVGSRWRRRRACRRRSGSSFGCVVLGPYSGGGPPQCTFWSGVCYLPPPVLSLSLSLSHAHTHLPPSTLQLHLHLHVRLEKLMKSQQSWVRIPCQFQACMRQERFPEVCTVKADWEEFHFWIELISAAWQARRCRFAGLSAPRKWYGMLEGFGFSTEAGGLLEGVNCVEQQQLRRWHGSSSSCTSVLPHVGVVGGSRLAARALVSSWGPAHRCRAGGHDHRDMAPIISCTTGVPGETRASSLVHTHSFPPPLLLLSFSHLPTHTHLLLLLLLLLPPQTHPPTTHTPHTHCVNPGEAMNLPDRM